jgi:hypothetical protein
MSLCTAAWNIRGVVDSVVLLISLFSVFPFFIIVTDYQTDCLCGPQSSFYSASFVFHLPYFLYGRNFLSQFYTRLHEHVLYLYLCNSRRKFDVNLPYIFILPLLSSKFPSHPFYFPSFHHLSPTSHVLSCSWS